MNGDTLVLDASGIEGDFNDYFSTLPPVTATDPNATPSTDFNDYFSTLPRVVGTYTGIDTSLNYTPPATSAGAFSWGTGQDQPALGEGFNLTSRLYGTLFQSGKTGMGPTSGGSAGSQPGVRNVASVTAKASVGEVLLIGLAVITVGWLAYKLG